MCLSVVIVSLDTTVVNVALAPISRDVGATTGQLQWITDAYLVTYAGLLLLAGALGDRAGHKRMLLGGLAVFGAGSVLAAASGSAGVLIAWRAVMGAGAAAIMPASLAMVTAAFGGQGRAKALGIWSAAAGGGVAAGPLLGGAVIDAGSWRAVFLINVPLVVFALAADLWLPDPPRRSRHLDVAGAALVTAAIAAVTAGVIESPGWGWLSVRVAALYLVAAGAAAGFIVRQRRAADPLITLSWLRDRRLTVPGAVAAGLFFALTGASFALMLYLQLVLGYSPLRAGLAILPAVAVTTIAAAAAGTLVPLAGARALMAGGMASLAGGLAWLATATTQADYWGRLLPAGCLFGLGIGLALTPASDAVLGSAAGTRPGVASGIIETVEEMASALGIAVVGAVLSARFAAGLTGMPSPVAAAAGSPAGAIAAARRLDPGHITQVTAAFTHAMTTGLWITAGVAAATAIAALAHPRT